MIFSCNPLLRNNLYFCRKLSGRCDSYSTYWFFWFRRASPRMSGSTQRSGTHPPFRHPHPTRYPLTTCPTRSCRSLPRSRCSEWVRRRAFRWACAVTNREVEPKRRWRIPCESSRTEKPSIFGSFRVWEIFRVAFRGHFQSNDTFTQFGESGFRPFPFLCVSWTMLMPITGVSIDFSCR